MIHRLSLLVRAFVRRRCSFVVVRRRSSSFVVVRCRSSFVIVVVVVGVAVLLSSCVDTYNNQTNANVVVPGGTCFVGFGLGWFNK